MAKYNVHIINLEKRKDRWEEVNREVKKSHIINPIRFNAVTHKWGENGCALSHIILIEEAKKANRPYVIVWEDDTEIRSGIFDQMFVRIMGYLESNSDWDIFNGNPANVAHKKDQQVTVLYPYPVMVNYGFSTSTNFMIYSSRVYDKILALKDGYTGAVRGKAVDMRISELGLRNVTCVPYLTRQRDGRSDIMNKDIKYDGYILEKGEKHILGKIKRDYICGRLLGGLGNQMFVMAAAFCMAKREGCLLVLNKSVLAPHLGHGGYWGTFFNFLDFPVPFNGADKNEGEGKEFQYRDIKKTAPRVNLTGYFQHRGFFHGMRDELRRFFAPEPRIVEELKGKYGWLSGGKRCVAVHVRRGDYVKLKHIHHNVPLKYYQMCRDKINAKYGRDKVLYVVFSDDIGWCKSNMGFGDRFVEGEVDYKEMILMTMCGSHIIANSTFSWWGAYLGRGDDVYMPGKWMERPPTMYPNGLVLDVLDGWNKIGY